MTTEEAMAARIGELSMQVERLTRGLRRIIERDTYPHHHNARGVFAKIARETLGESDD